MRAVPIWVDQYVDEFPGQANQDIEQHPGPAPSAPRAPRGALPQKALVQRAPSDCPLVGAASGLLIAHVAKHSTLRPRLNVLIGQDRCRILGPRLQRRPVAARLLDSRFGYES